MSVDFATLALRVENSQANTAFDETSRRQENLTAKVRQGTDALDKARASWAQTAAAMAKAREQQDRLAPSVNRYTESINRMHVAAAQSGADKFAKEIERLDPFHQKAAAGAEKHTLALGKINQAFEGLAVEALGVNSRLGSVAGKFLEFGAGSTTTLGILGGLAIVTLAWDKLTESERKAQAETQKAIDLLTDLRRKKLLGPGGETGDAVERAKALLPQERLTLDAKTRELASLGKDQLSIRALQLKEEIRQQKDRIAQISAIVSDGEDEVRRLKKEADDKTAQDRKDAQDKEFNDWKEHIQRIIDLAKNTKDPYQIWGDNTDAAKSRTDDLEKRGFGKAVLATDNSGRNAAADRLAAGQKVDRYDFLASLTRYGQQTAIAVTTAAHVAQVLKEVTEQDAKNAALRSIGANSALSLLGQSGAGGSAASGIIQAGISGASGGPWGIAISGVTAFASTVIGSGRAAAQAALQMKALRASIDDTILSWKAELGQPGADRALQEARIRAEAQAERDKVLSTPEAAAAAVLHSKEAAQWVRDHLDEINRLEKDRIDALGKEKKALDEVNQSMLNFVEGYKLQSTIFQAANPRNGRPRPTILPFGGGSSGGEGGDLTIPVTVDGEVIATAVIRNFRRKAQTQTGDASNWTELRA